MPIVSVIIPAYNASQFIAEALDSVFAQTFDDFEVIVIDDGSTDDTREIVQKYQKKLKYVYQENAGPSSARNSGIRMAEGNYIAFLDSDDLWLPDKLEKQVAVFKANPKLGMVITENILFDERGIFCTKVGKKEYLMNGDLVANIFLRSGVVTPTIMVRRDVFDEVGYFEEYLRIAEDDNMWIRIAAEFDVDLLDESLTKVRGHQLRTMRLNFDQTSYIQDSINMLMNKYGDPVRSRIKNLVPRKLFQVHFATGYQHFDRKESKLARKAFAKAISHKKVNTKGYLYYIMSLIPNRLLNFLRTIKRKLVPSISRSRWTR